MQRHDSESNLIEGKSKSQEGLDHVATEGNEKPLDTNTTALENIQKRLDVLEMSSENRRKKENYRPKLKTAFLMVIIAFVIGSFYVHDTKMAAMEVVVGLLTQGKETLKQDVGSLKQGMEILKQDVGSLKQGMEKLKQDVGLLKQDMKVAAVEVAVGSLNEEKVAKIISFMEHKYPDAFLCLVGMKDGRVADKDITSSGFAIDDHHSHIHARLDNQPSKPFEVGAWQANPIKDQWIQVNLRKPTVITGVVTQGRPVVHQEWVTKFKVSYSNSGKYISDIRNNKRKVMLFHGNINGHECKVNRFPQPITAQYVRITVLEWHSRPSLRLDFTTC